MASPYSALAQCAKPGRGEVLPNQHHHQPTPSTDPGSSSGCGETVGTEDVQKITQRRMPSLFDASINPDVKFEDQHRSQTGVIPRDCVACTLNDEPCLGGTPCERCVKNANNEVEPDHLSWMTDCLRHTFLGCFRLDNDALTKPPAYPEPRSLFNHISRPFDALMSNVFSQRDFDVAKILPSKPTRYFVTEDHKSRRDILVGVLSEIDSRLSPPSLKNTELNELIGLRSLLLHLFTLVKLTFTSEIVSLASQDRVVLEESGSRYDFEEKIIHHIEPFLNSPLFPLIAQYGDYLNKKIKSQPYPIHDETSLGASLESVEDQIEQLRSLTRC